MNVDLVALLDGIAAAEKAEQRMYALPIAEMRAVAELAAGGVLSTKDTRVSMTVEMFERLVARAERARAVEVLTALASRQSELANAAPALEHESLLWEQALEETLAELRKQA